MCVFVCERVHDSDYYIVGSPFNWVLFYLIYLFVLLSSKVYWFTWHVSQYDDDWRVGLPRRA
jgi:hypothetical protein